DIWVLPVSPAGVFGDPRPYIRTPFNENYAHFAPGRDPKWVAYTSDESGRNEVYLAGYLDAHEKFRVSTDGGSSPSWEPGGRRLYYTSKNSLMAADLELRPDGIAPSVPRRLFSFPGPDGRFDVSPDGKRFLVSVPVKSEPQPLSVMVNWPALM